MFFCLCILCLYRTYVAYTTSIVLCFMCICVKQFALSAVGTVISGEASESDDESNIPLDLQTALQGMHCMLCDV